jgi:nicotinate-nucleotide--dimethylbenzimidazole phosphoribosyltransferase
MSDLLRLHETLERIVPVDQETIAAAEQELDRKTKPRRSLGELERLAAQYAGIRGEVAPEPPVFAVVVAAADHGYAEDGVSAYPAEVTAQMVRTFSAGGAAISVLAREAGARLVVADAGVREPVDGAGVRDLRIGAGTANAARGPAMTREQALRAIVAGIDLGRGLADDGVTAVALGDMGIGNTTSAAALHARLLGVDPAQVCGPGTGLDADGVRRKVSVVESALAANPRRGDDPVEALAALGGFEIAVLAGAILGAASTRLAVVLDGFIVGAAALVAARLAPASKGYLIAGHLSPEPGHRLALVELGLEPLLALELRLGEATGAALALPLLRSAVAILSEMATFETAGVTDAGR